MPSTFEVERLNVGEGWLPLVDELHAQINVIMGDHQILQIKEKFGGLRYYFALLGATADQMKQVQDLVGVAEHASFSICEECGEPGETKSIGGWYKTLCEKHVEEARARRKS